MAKEVQQTKEKNEELIKYRDLVLATIDYYVDNQLLQIKTKDLDSGEFFNALKLQVHGLFENGRLNHLKQWFRDLTEMQIETVDLKFNSYLKDKTRYDIDIFKSYFDRIERIIAKGKITTDNQFYEINSMVDQLCQIPPVDKNKIEVLNKLLGDYEQRKSRKTKKNA